MSVQHGSYTHDDSAGYFDERCPNCAHEKEVRRLTAERDAARASEKRLAELLGGVLEALERLALDRHVHESAPGGACRICGGDIREPVHFNIGESRETDLAHARAALKKARGE